MMRTLVVHEAIYILSWTYSKWISRASSWALANGNVVSWRAIGAVTAGRQAGIDALKVLASLVLVAVLVGGTLS